MKRNDIINSLIAINGYKTYLEIGVGDCAHYNSIICNKKTNVDPCFDTYDKQNTGNVVNVMTSDKFFEKNEEKPKI